MKRKPTNQIKRLYFRRGLNSYLFIILAAYVAYVCVYMSYLRDGFHLPRRVVFFVCMVLMAAGAFVFFCMR